MASCGAPQHEAPRTSLLTLAKSAEGSGPATWRYHPSRPAKMHAKVELTKGSALYVGEGGERWLTTPKGAPRAAPRLAGETLVFAAPRGDRWVFVGASGTHYIAATPLGEFSRVVAPTRGLERMSVGDEGLAGVDTHGALVSLELEASGASEWVPAKVPGARQVDRFADVELVGAREGYALSFPERLWMTSDSGRSWRPLDAPRVGAHTLVRQGEGVVVRGHREEQRIVKGAVKQGGGGGAAPKGLEIEAELGYGPRASALEQRSAVLLGERYLEIARTPGKRTWELRSGTLKGELSVRPVSLPECATIKLGAFERRLVVACGERPGDPSQPIGFYESADAGKDWHELEVEAVGRIAGLELAVGDAGALLVSGLCKEDASAAGCIPEGIHSLAEEEEGGLKFRPATTPSLRGRALTLGFSPDGRVAVAAGIRAKDAHFAVFTSTDGGKTFRGEDIAEVPMVSERSAPPRVRFGAGDDATFGFSVAYGPETHLVVTDYDGRPLMVNEGTPSGTQALGIAGGRGLAQGRGEVWETQDGGAEWRSLGPLPGKLCESGSCETSVVCSVSGCVVGDFLSRSGWGKPSEELPIVPRPGSAQQRVRRLRTPLVCTLSEPPERSLPRLTSAPKAEAAVLGADAWWFLAADSATGAVTLLRAGHRGRESRVDAQVLLPPLKSAVGYRVHRAVNQHGAAAARYLPAPGGGVQQLEVAWYDAADGKLRSRRIGQLGVREQAPAPKAPPAKQPQPKAPAAKQPQPRGGSGILKILEESGGEVSGLFGPIDPSELSGLFDSGRSAAGGGLGGLGTLGSGGLGVRGVGLGSGVVQPAPGGVFLQASGEAAYFIDEASSRVAFPTARWSTSGSVGVTLGWVHASKEDGGVALELSVLNHAAAVVRDPRGTIDVMSFGTLEARVANRQLELALTAHAGRELLQVTRFDERGRGGTIVLPIAASLGGEPLPAPSQVALGAAPTRCSASDLTSGPRIVEPFLNGGRHPVIVVGDEAERVLISGSVVLGGTATAPCLAALDAHGVEDDADHALILPHDLEHAWLFQRAPEGQPPGFEPLPMSCRFDPTATVPPEIYALPGVSVQAE
ncbi:MAG: hypothetical protein KIT72_01215 [Polyangiaceae bacterium]|nr:hypothetical protein [Polyangiaceae bacterium]